MCIQDKHARFRNSEILAVKSVPSQKKISVIFFLHCEQITSES